jgi:hypothetical protein
MLVEKSSIRTEQGITESFCKPPPMLDPAGTM